jgi:hypothetical protein
MTFLVVCKETFQTGVFNCSEDFVEGGRQKVERASEVYKKFYGDNPEDDINSYYISETL